ncbi:nucleoside-diphosphate-sugar epimerase [Virgibacillus natechei]|uniref:Nucleoside-diphosphate-sugar epimerase n=1 Tax=Virgibacillus natechei TaxID=1216297 RepID=A0ABS4III7_9BACI|nr:nucleoside-diphosphate-sugar epimerase [Virgibacillus natechei]
MSDEVNHPVSLYAATKKSNKLMAHTYSHLYEISTTGLRCFTRDSPQDWVTSHEESRVTKTVVRTSIC